MKKNVSKKFLKNLENLSYVGYKILDEENGNSQTIGNLYKEYKNNIKSLQYELDSFYSNINYKENEKRYIDRRISRTQRDIENFKGKSFWEKIKYRKNYKEMKQYIKELNIRKKEISREVKMDYIELREKRIELNQAYKELKAFEKYVNVTAREKSNEIKYVKYFEKNRATLEHVYSKEQLNKIEKNINDMISGRNQNIDIDAALNQLKRDVKTRRKNKKMDSVIVHKSKDNKNAQQENENSQEHVNTVAYERFEQKKKEQMEKKEKEFRERMHVDKEIDHNVRQTRDDEEQEKVIDQQAQGGR